MSCLSGSTPWYLFGTSTTGHKLRIKIPDTAVVEAQVLKAWVYTDKQTGVVHSMPRSQLSTAALLHKLTGQHAAFEADNPAGWMAVVHFSSGITRLVTAKELQQLLSAVYVGAVPESDFGTAGGLDASQLVMVQAYKVPLDDERYITTFGGVEGAAMFTQVLSYSDRYLASGSAAAAAKAGAATVQQAKQAASAAASGQDAAGDCDNLQDSTEGTAKCPRELRHCITAAPASLGSSSAAMLAAVDDHHSWHPGSQLAQQLQTHTDCITAGDFDVDFCAIGLEHGVCATPTLPAGSARGSAAELADTDSSSGAEAGVMSQPGDTDGQAGVRAASRAVSRAAAAAVQVLISYLDKAHGLRVQGVVAECVRDLGEQLWLIGLHSIVVDPQQSKGSTVTFTERWEEFLQGSGPPPTAPPPCNATHGTPSSATAALSPTAAASAGASMSKSPMGLGPAVGRAGLPNPLSSSLGSPSRQLNKQFFPLLSGETAELHGSRPGSADSAARVNSRPSSAPRPLRPTSPQLGRPASSSPSRQRPGTLPGVSGSPTAASMALLSSNGLNGGAPRYTGRNAASAARAGAGGNPTARPGGSESYAVWMQQPLRPADSVTAQLAAQLGHAKQQVQQFAAMAEAAQLQASSTTAQATQQVASCQQELLQLRHDATAAGRERRQLQQRVSELDQQRSSQAAAMAALQQQLAQLQEQLGQDRGTLATMLRQHQQREQQLEEEVAHLQQQNSTLQQQNQQLTARLDEEAEVVSALRAQLVDYKLQMGQMQAQTKKSRGFNTNSSNSFAMRRGGSVTPPAGALQAGTGLSSSGVLLGQPGMSVSGAATPLLGPGEASLLGCAGWNVAGPARGISTSGGIKAQHGGADVQRRGTAAANAASGSNSPHSQPSAQGQPPSSQQIQAQQQDLVGKQGNPHMAAKTAVPCFRQPPEASSTANAACVAVAKSTTFASDSTAESRQQQLPQQRQTGQQQQQQWQSSPKNREVGITDLDAAIAGITASITAELGEGLAAAAQRPPQLFIGDLLGGQYAAEQQLAIIAGLLKDCYGDLQEIYSHYAMLGGVQVVADRVIMELPKFGKLAYDLHISQDNKSLAAVEDVFWTLSDRKPCQIPLASSNKTSAITAAAAGASIGRTASANLGPGIGQAVTRAAALNSLAKSALGEETGVAASTAAAVMGADVIVLEQFPEALIRLACVRYRWGPVSDVYGWNESSSEESEEDEAELSPRGELQTIGESAALGGIGAASMRAGRLQQQKNQQLKRSKSKHGPKVLRPERVLPSGAGHGTAHHASSGTSPRDDVHGNTGNSSRSTSPNRQQAAEWYSWPAGKDDLVTVVKTFMQHEVLKHGRRNRLAGSPLGHRRAQHKQPNLISWEALPHGSLVKE